jgi:hypothetical protein
MYTSKRIFTKNDINLNYQDYNKLKNGIQALKTIKMEDNLAILKQFNSYQSWQTLTSAYFPFIDNNTFEISSLKNIYDANESFTERNNDILENDSMCKNVLYPYGKIVSKRVVNPHFPTNIYLCKWCNNKPKLKPSLYELDESIIDESITEDCKCKKNNKNCNLCKNARALFI